MLSFMHMPCWRPLPRGVPPPGARGRGTGLAGPRTQGPGPWLARGEEGAQAPWRIRTELAPAASEAGWDGLRAWMEQGFHSTTRAGWPWPRPRLRDPDRAARLWLAVAVATWWWRRVGGATDAIIPGSTWLAVTGWCPERPRTRRAPRLRRVSVCRHGGVRRLVALRRQDLWPAGRVVPEPWPVVPPWAETVCEWALAMPEAA